MNIHYLNNVLMIASLVLFGACQSNPCKKSNEPEPLEKVVKIEYQHYGGMGWLSEILSITQDSISYSFSLYIQKESRHYGIAADASVWDSLMTKLDLALFKKIQNGHSRLPVDGTDTEFSVITASGKQYSFINGTEDKSFKKLQTFFDLINDLRQKYYTNSKM